MPTKKLFEADPYMKECEAAAVSVMGPEVVLDQTVLFAFSGGQASDRGTINGIPVKEATVSGDRIVYILEQPANFSEGDKVQVKLDWDNRYTIMKLHTAAHLAYFFMKEKVNFKRLIGSNIHPGKARIDFEAEESIAPLLPDIEQKMNEFIQSGAEVKTYEDEAEPGKFWWECNEWKIPCGGTHVKNTSEIGQVKLKRKNIGAGKERVEVTLTQ